MSGFLNTWIGLLSDRVGLVSNGVGLFSGERILENMPTPSLNCHLSSLPMGVFSRAYSTWFTFPGQLIKLKEGKVMGSLHTDTCRAFNSC